MSEKKEEPKYIICEKCREEIFPERHRYYKLTIEIFLHEKCLLPGADNVQWKGTPVIKLEKIFNPSLKSQARKVFMDPGEQIED